MASKRRCRTCKVYKPVGSGILTPNNAFFCCPEHAAQYAITAGNKRREKIKLEKQKQERKERQERKRDRRWYLKKAQEVFNRYIRQRDKEYPCISCSRYSESGWNAGHYRTTAAASQLRFNEDNCHLQCVQCNMHLSSNRDGYRINLIHKIGVERVEALENDNTVRKWSIDELKEIIEIYRKKIDNKP